MGKSSKDSNQLDICTNINMAFDTFECLGTEKLNANLVKHLEKNFNNMTKDSNGATSQIEICETVLILTQPGKTDQQSSLIKGKICMSQ